MEEKTEAFETSFPLNQIKVLLLEGIDQEAISYFVSLGFTVESIPKITQEELILKISDAHVVGVRSKTKLDKTVLSHAKKLLCVGCFCIGTDQTDLEYAAERGIPVFNVIKIDGCTKENLSKLNNKKKEKGERHVYTTTKNNCNKQRFRGKTMGIIGYGHVGSQLSVLAEAMGMNVIYYDVIPKLPLGNAVAKGSIDEILEQSHFVSLHVPYTPDTHEMIGKSQIAKMKKGSYLMNAARGKCVDIKAAADALKNGHLGGAYFDVYPTEPTDANLPLCNCPNTILTPHIGGSTMEAQKAIGLEVAEKIGRFINEGRTIAAVNFPEISLPPNLSAHRILNVHKNVPGVMRKTMEILCNYNISAQALKTASDIGYMLIEVDADKKLSREVRKQMNALPETICTRIVYSPGAINSDASKNKK
ncbi:3-phosphoglycerate dehydrogenase [Reticulomyxa filosa]|uniref:2-oxoglutarate reductase n=1 Tax=Reticulomyxa filosa TaxID=46433 RepID=X6P7J9_RETFI|nr:3-phosphoglycerate dehydrogenase [Reticulomyxa filosa]|eukprot:ETO34490.1 3-phosphoglycerate dehydrogenase [Reticulomyxa filosa]